VHEIGLYPYALKSEIPEIILDVILIAMYIFLVIREIIELIRERGNYLDDVWNIIDLTNYALFLIVLILRIILYITLSGIHFNSQIDQFNDLENVVFLDRVQKDFSGALLIIAWGLLLKYLRIVYSVGILMRIVKRQIFNVLNFLVVYVVFIVGFGAAFNITLSDSVYSFRSWPASILSLFRVITGDGTWDSIIQSSEYFSLALYVAHAIIGVILLLNLLIAMLNDSYASVIAVATVEYLCEKANIIDSYDSAVKKQLKDLSSASKMQNLLSDNDDEPPVPPTSETEPQLGETKDAKTDEAKEPPKTDEKKEEEKKGETPEQGESLELVVMSDKPSTATGTTKEEKKKDKYGVELLANEH